MSEKRKIYTSVLLFSAVMTGCIDPYDVPTGNEEIDILVVDGFLNSTEKSASVKLTKALALAKSTEYTNEHDALVTIEDTNGNTFYLDEKQVGRYEACALNISASTKYQLHIKTASGKEYRSELIELKQSPPIDSITWKPSPDGITIYVNAHDPTNRTRYYQWKYTETWEYNADYYSVYKIESGAVVPREANEIFYTCWNTAPSTRIMINSTLRLSSDIVHEFPLVFIERGSKKISRTYSMLLQQRALTDEAYNYWLQLQKTTESLGGLFDPLPYRLLSNVHNVADDADPVLGYFNGGSVTEKRVFIRFSDLPDYLLYIPAKCMQDTLKDLTKYNSSTYIIDAIGHPPTGYLVAPTSCADCRATGGTLTKPDFWPW